MLALVNICIQQRSLTLDNIYVIYTFLYIHMPGVEDISGIHMCVCVCRQVMPQCSLALVDIYDMLYIRYTFISRVSMMYSSVVCVSLYMQTCDTATLVDVG